MLHTYGYVLGILATREPVEWGTRCVNITSRRDGSSKPPTAAEP
jgi:hypothetical protein